MQFQEIAFHFGIYYAIQRLASEFSYPKPLSYLVSFSEDPHASLLYIIPLIYHASLTVSREKVFGSKGKPYHKHKASNTKSHTQGFHQMQSKKTIEYFQGSSDQA